MERQDANAQAYRSDVTAKMLLSGQVPPPDWAQSFIQTLESCTGMPGNRQWVDDNDRRPDDGYLFGGTESPRNENGSSRKRPGMGSRKNSSVGSYFDFNEDSSQTNRPLGRARSATAPSSSPGDEHDEPTTDFFSTKFESDFNPNSVEGPRKGPRFSTANPPLGTNGYPFQSGVSDVSSHKRSVSAYTPSSSLRFEKKTNPFDEDSGYGGRPSFDFENNSDHDRDVFGAPLSTPLTPASPPPKLAPKAELSRPLQPHEGVARAIALYDFNAVQVSINVL